MFQFIYCLFIFITQVTQTPNMFIHVELLFIYDTQVYEAIKGVSFDEWDVFFYCCMVSLLVEIMFLISLSKNRCTWLTPEELCDWAHSI